MTQKITIAPANMNDRGTGKVVAMPAKMTDKLTLDFMACTAASMLGLRLTHDTLTNGAY